MTRRIFRCILLASFCVLLAAIVIIMGFLYSYYSGIQQKQLQDELELAAGGGRAARATLPVWTPTPCASPG